MKKQILLTMTAIMVIATMVFAGNQKTVKFKVYGNCGMCEKTIEKAAKNVVGVEKANWNKKTKMIEVSFDSEKTNEDAIHQAIADVGYDTEKVKAEDEVYNKLHSCCKYDRDE